ncbi:Imm1 family immunity protein [Spirillospora sp. NPDC048824]|uniref:Imm1 family immunity protein n=1 Tax=Spirillospora sp. NPDC048824 TaxID=3364526 RepID=UPI003717EB59
MLILNASLRQSCSFGLSWPQAERLLDEVAENRPDIGRPAPEPVGDGRVPAHLLAATMSLTAATLPYGGTQASFMLSAPHRVPHRDRWDSSLDVTINARTGYGALRWMVSADTVVPVDPEVADHLWLSDNPDPPRTDPSVFADPWLPSYHYPNSTLPVAQIRAAVEEFCRTRTGQRPTCIDWTPGEWAGHRLDMPRLVHKTTDRDPSDGEDPWSGCKDPWAAQPEPEAPSPPTG